MPTKTNISMVRRIETWRRSLTKEQRAEIEGLPLRRDMTTLLIYLRDHKTVGTQGTGNFKLKDVRAITAQFVNPPILDHTVGDHTYKLRTETDIWPLYFLHVLAEIGGLIEGGSSRIWRLTPNGEKFLDVIPEIQLWLMLLTWFKQVNWLIAYPFEGMGESLPTGFRRETLQRLCALPTDKRIPFEPFADELIEATGLSWSAPDSRFARITLHGSILRMVIHILANFGLLEREYTEEDTGRGKPREKLTAFLIKSWGQGLLKSL
jgi:hypothetical protein